MKCLQCGKQVHGSLKKRVHDNCMEDRRRENAKIWYNNHKKEKHEYYVNKYFQEHALLV